MLTQNHNLDMTPNGVPIVVNASQYDVGREIHFYLYNGSEVFTPTAGSAIRIEGTKPDNTGFSYSASWTDNIVTVTLTDQMTVLAGEVKCELRVTLGGDDVGSLNFILLVEKAALNSNIPISDTEIPAIIQLARTEQYNAEAWAIGTRNGVPVTSDDETYQNNSKWYSEHSSTSTLTALADVSITTPTDGQSLIYDANTTKWVNGSGTSAMGALDDLTDVTITSATDGQVLSYDDNSSEWVNTSLATVATTGDYSDLSNKPSLATVATTGDYSDLSNTPTIPTVDQVYDGTSANAQSGVAVASVISTKADVSDVGYWTTAVSAILGATTITITDANILTTSKIDIYTENTSNTEPNITGKTISSGQLILTFDVLEEATSFLLHIY